MKLTLTRFIASITLSLLCAWGAAAQTAASGQLNDRISWTLADSVLTISGTGKMPGFNSTNLEKLPWQDERFAAEVAKIVIEEGITEVGNYCFGSRIKVRNVRNVKGHTFYSTQDATTTELFYNIKEVQLPSTLKKIGSHAFARMPITGIVLPDAVEEIGAGAFTNTALTCVILPPKLRKLGNETFCGCQNLRAVDFNNAAIRLPGGLLFDAERLRMIMHTSKIKGVMPSTFSSTALERYSEEELLEMFATDGPDYYLKMYVPKREDFDGSDDEYAALQDNALDQYYQREAKNATSMFELDRFVLMPYDADSGTLTIRTLHHGTLLLPLSAAEAGEFAANQDEIIGNANPVFYPDNGRVKLQSVNFKLSGKVVVASIL